MELEEAAAERVRAGLGDDVDERRGLAAELAGYIDFWILNSSIESTEGLMTRLLKSSSVTLVPSSR